MSNKRFITKYCNITDSVLVLDTLKRMPLTMLIDGCLYVNGLNCMDMERAEEQQEYYENLCGYQRSLFQPVNSFTITSEKWLGHYALEYSLIDNTGNVVISSFDESTVLKWKEWLESEINGRC